MFTKSQMHLAKTFIKIYYRDRQSLSFSLLFPLIFTLIFLFSGGEPDPTEIGLVNHSENDLSLKFVELAKENKTFAITEGDEVELRGQLIAGDLTALIIVPKDFDKSNTSRLRLLLDASQVRQVDAIKDSFNSMLLSIERELRDTQPLFTLSLEDVKARPQRYIDFLLPGILAYMLMNLCIAGSGYNLVEYRRRNLKADVCNANSTQGFYYLNCFSKDVYCIDTAFSNTCFSHWASKNKYCWWSLFAIWSHCSWCNNFFMYWILSWKLCQNSRGYSTHCIAFYVASVNSFRSFFSNLIFASANSTRCASSSLKRYCLFNARYSK